MSKTHRLTPEQWESIERYADDNTYDACFLELRARIEALEVGAACPHVRSSDEGTSYCALAEAVAAQQSPLFTAEEVARIVAPITRDRDETNAAAQLADSLLDRVAMAVCEAPNNHEGWRSEARAALREVAAWLRSELISRNVADLLDNEANR
jgi:hypothetical protein